MRSRTALNVFVSSHVALNHYNGRDLYTYKYRTYVGIRISYVYDVSLDRHWM